MSVRNLEYLFRPRSVAVIGASDRPQSIGATVMRNLLEGGFAGPIWPVNPKHGSVAGRPAFRDVASLPQPPDLAVICTPAHTVPGIIAELGRCGTRAAVVITAGLSAVNGPGEPSLQQAMLDAAKPHLLRILGPNCVGLLVPGCGLNASFAHTSALPGKLAFVSQSGALTTALLDWAKSRDIGFSHFISLGDSADVDFGDVLDYLGSDPSTRAILMYMESVQAARKFMSAARAAARNKPVLLVKAGRAPAGVKAAASHTGALAGSDAVFDAAVRRAGMLRVATLTDLFAAAETLARARPFKGERLAIMTNGGGAAVLAADALALGGGVLTDLSSESMHQLQEFLPPTWSRGNPVDIIGDAPVERYLRTLKILLADPGADAVLFMHAPTAIVPSAQIASACVPLMQAAAQPVLGCWLGGDAVMPARSIFAGAGIPSYDSPEQAVGGFLQLADFHRNQTMLMQTPPSIPQGFVPDLAAARRIIKAVLADGRDLLNEPESKALLAAYDIPVVETRVVANALDAERAATAIGFPVVLKILSPDISHKSDVGGVALKLETTQEVALAAQGMLQRVGELRPDATLAGFTVQAMVRRPHAHELIVGASTDPIFGPVILFGQGGVAVEVIGDRAVALPPLNMALARDLVSHTRVSRLLAGYRDRVAIDHEALDLVLLKVSQLICDCPEVVELDINPLLADDQGVVALDARVKVVPARSAGAQRLAIRPYPAEFEERIDFGGRSVLVRPIRPEDEPRLRAFFAAAEPEDLRTRFFMARREFAHSELARFSQIDYEREMTFIAVAPEASGEAGMLGEVRASTDPDNLRAEFAIMVRSDLKGRGLGRALLAKMIRYLKSRGTGVLVGECLRQNDAMAALARGLGFSVTSAANGGAMSLSLDLQPVTCPAQPACSAE
ncbi:MAG: bifunctional acetate--CoA ligase family protein/GNAT family N-acetyltransferase [Polaromonas sp.]|uniref:bifunctional acetate--CoA ligase family protein/GNAT family N-acetyltransferase n=1 Tax=Polaromonas sp. TaxID=1869339 RepID=UPI00272F81CC|nr:bifunctional acetate--CoA ligase family protein/GNAT family N-acetyltransferase [Polaromonas sp.]MDP2256507.1 bifunctional acetate--CoA ligase family protein/GNAT family N-acetyltransferase [Polaromonas sp.]